MAWKVDIFFVTLLSVNACNTTHLQRLRQKIGSLVVVRGVCSRFLGFAKRIMKQKRRRLRKNKIGLVSPRQVLNNGNWRQLSFDEKVFVALTWLGFTNAEAWGVINPMSEASANSRAVMAGRYACNPNVKTYVDTLNEYLQLGLLGFKGQSEKVGNVRQAVEEYENEKQNNE